MQNIHHSDEKKVTDRDDDNKKTGEASLNAAEEVDDGDEKSIETFTIQIFPSSQSNSTFVRKWIAIASSSTSFGMECHPFKSLPEFLLSRKI